MAASTRLTPAQRTARARRAALTKNALAPDSMEAARAKKRELFEAAVDPDGTLDPAERAKRTDRLWRAWHIDLGNQASRKLEGGPKLRLVEWLEAATNRAAQKRAAAVPHVTAAAQEEERDAAAPTP